MVSPSEIDRTDHYNAGEVLGGLECRAELLVRCPGVASSDERDGFIVGTPAYRLRGNLVDECGMIEAAGGSPVEAAASVSSSPLRFLLERTKTMACHDRCHGTRCSAAAKAAVADNPVLLWLIVDTTTDTLGACTTLVLGYQYCTVSIIVTESMTFVKGKNYFP